MKKSIEQLIFQKGSELLKTGQKQNFLFLEKNWWYKKMLARTMKNADLKTRLFRFIDVLPSLSDDQQFLAHFKEYFKGDELGLMVSGLGQIAPSIMTRNIKEQIKKVAQIFITGESISSALTKLSKNWEEDMASSIDILGEATLSEEEAEFYYNKYLELMDSLVSHRQKWSKKDKLQKDIFGEIPSVNISIKASSLFSQIKLSAWEYSKEHLKNRLRPLFQKAVQNFIFINLDMEQYCYKDLFLEIFKELIMEEEFKTYPHFGIVIQTYLKSSLGDLKDLSQFLEKRGHPITVRLVKGAYWDSEVLLARQKNWPVPVYTQKEETDINFENCVSWLFEKSSHIKIAVGSHNIRSLACAMSWHERHPEKPLEFQFLYGMVENLAKTLADQGYCVRLYCTMGDLIPGMSYLVRRLLENSANQSFILNSFLKNKSIKELLESPQKTLEKKKSSPPFKSSTNTESFANHPLLDFSIKSNRDNFEKSLKEWRKKFPVKVPLILEGKEIQSSQTLSRENPNQIDQIISQSSLAQKDLAERAVQSVESFFPEWKAYPSQRRLDHLRKLAQLIKDKEFELSALQVFEVGKTWEEAQADVAEAIDFCNYYAFSYEQLIQKKRTDKTFGEENYSYVEPIGPTAVISPWNFPLAILTGMTVAPLVCGNTVIIKPAEQSPVTAFYLAQLLLESGFPKQSFAFLPGKGEEVGNYLVRSPRISIISFTGSFEVGAQIIKQAGEIKENQKDIKKCIVEMGGKNAIVIDSSADLDEAVSGVLSSAFGFQGQKCSACSRVIVVEDVYERFMARFLPAVKSLLVDSSEKPQSHIGPLIDQHSFQRIKKLMEEEKSHLLFKGKAPEGDKTWFCPPLVYLAESHQSRFQQEEFFAPVVAVFKAKDFHSAMEKTNQTRFGLTSALYSRHPGHIEKFKSFVEVGNLYINRNCTGALVKRHPFGGRKMSGLGSKAGGPDYLKNFLHTKIVSENSIRRGFSPELF